MSLKKLDVGIVTVVNVSKETWLRSKSCHSIRSARGSNPDLSGKAPFRLCLLLQISMDNETGSHDSVIMTHVVVNMEFLRMLPSHDVSI